MDLMHEEALAALHTSQNIVYPLIAGVGIVANVVVIVVITIWERLRKNRTIANVFIVNLAVADLLFVIILPLYMPALLDEGWKFGRFLCKFSEAIKYVNFRASILFLTTMTIDRFVAIVYSLESRGYRVRKNGFKISVGIWIVSSCFAVPVLVYTNVHNESGKAPRCRIEFPGYRQTTLDDDALYELFPNFSVPEQQDYNESVQYDSLDGGGGSGGSGPFNYDLQGSYDGVSGKNHLHDLPCKDEGHENSATYTAWICINFILFFLLPTLIVAYCYIRIIMATVSSDVTSTRETGVHKQLAIMVALLVGVFIVCWLPFQMFELLSLTHLIQITYRVDCQIFRTAFSMLAWTNSAINPILYTISSRKFNEKVVMAWTYVTKGKTGVLAMQTSQRTVLTRLHTTVGGSTKNLNVSLATAKYHQPTTQTDKSKLKQNTAFS